MAQHRADADRTDLKRSNPRPSLSLRPLANSCRLRAAASRPPSKWGGSSAAGHCRPYRALASRSGLIFGEQDVSMRKQGCGVRLEQLTRGPIRLARELSLTGVVASDTWRPPTFL